MRYKYRVAVIDPYVLNNDGTWTPPVAPVHREADYDSNGFDWLRTMQTRHFWYRGRHRFLLHFTRKTARSLSRAGRQPEAVDLGGGCGGWVRYLSEHAASDFHAIALADSSRTALRLAAGEIPPNTRRYQIDLLNLQWSARWDVAFLLDVLEHIDEDAVVLEEIRRAVKPGGYLIVTTPALEALRTAVDDMTHHVRRYSRADLDRLANRTGWQLVISRYFMFFLSPLLWLARLSGPDVATMTRTDIRNYLDRTHRTPAGPINAALSAIFAAETPLGAWLPFPWGTSVLAVLRRPQD